MRDDFRSAFRQWRRTPGVTAAALLSLTLGIGANLALFSIVDAVVLKTLPIPHAEQLVRIVTGDFRPGEQHEITVSTDVWRYMHRHQRVFTSLLAISTDRVNIARGGEARYAGCAYVDAGYFDTLGLPVGRGRPLTASDDSAGAANVAVISYSLWRREYGGGEALGQPIYLDGHRFNIVGVAPRGFFGLQVGRRDDVIVPLAAQEIVRGVNKHQPSEPWLQVYGRLADGSQFETARAALHGWFPIVREATASPAIPSARHLPYAFDLAPAAHGLSFLRQQYRPALMLLFAAVAVLLLIACTNLATLTTARFADRQHEIGIRLSLGASRLRLTRLLIVDALVISVTASAFAVWVGHALAASLAPLLTFAQGRAVATQLELAIDARLLGVAVLLVCATTALTAALPALRLTTVESRASLGHHARAGKSRGTLRAMRALSSAQVALSVVLFVGALLLLRSFRELTTQPTGVDAEDVLVASVSDPFESQRGNDYLQRIERTRAALATVPGVTAVSAALVTPLSGLMAGAPLRVPGSITVRPTGLFNYVLPDYFTVLGTPVLIGREFALNDVAAGADGHRDVAVINKAFANHHFGGFNPIGRIMMVGERPLEIVGVVANARAMSLREDHEVPMAYGTIAQRPHAQSANLRWVIRARQPDALRPRIISALRVVDPRIAVELSTIRDDGLRGVGRERLLAWVAALFAGLALLITTIGIYGTFAYAVIRRRAEIGVRMALGATRLDVLRAMLRDAGALTVFGMSVGVGVAIAIATRPWLQSLLFGVSATDPTTYAVAIIGIGIAAAVATYFPARRASSLAPAETLRE